MTPAVMITGALLLGSAVQVVRTDNLVHAVFWLAAALILTAFAFVLLQAPFLAMIQLVLYTGGVITLMLFGVMLTERDPDTDVPNPMYRKAPAGLAALALLATLLTAIWTTPGLDTLTATALEGVDANGKTLGGVFLGDQVLAFEVLSVLLLAGMIGAIVLARKKDP